jgi:hypothetical protein
VSEADSSTDLVRRISMSGPQLGKQVRRMISRMLDRHTVAAKLFLDDDGAVRPAAVKWFGQLAADNYVNRGAFHADPREHAYREGRRELALEIIGSADLDVERLASLTRLERETE